MAEQENQNEHLNVEDTLTQSRVSLIEYKNVIIDGVVATVIIVTGFVMYKNLYVEPHKERAQAALFKGQEHFEQDAFEQALNDDSIGYIGFLRVVDDYSGTEAANLVKAYTGICYAQLDKYKEAVKMPSGFNGKDQMVALAILGTVGNYHTQLGRLDKTTSTLLSAADKADNNTLSPIFLIQAGETPVKQGKYDDTVDAHIKIKDKYFQSYQAMDIDKYIERAKLMKE